MHAQADDDDDARARGYRATYDPLLPGTAAAPRRCDLAARALVTRSAASSLPAEEGGAAASAATKGGAWFCLGGELLPLC